MKGMRFLRTHAAAFLLLILLVMFRLAASRWGIESVQPLAALSFCAVVSVGWSGVWIPLLGWGASYVLMAQVGGEAYTGSYGWALLASLLGIGCVVGVAVLLRSWGGGWRSQFVGLGIASLSFYAVTNTVSWLTLPGLYPLSWEGFVQAQWWGPPLLGPTWVFLRSGLLADYGFYALFSDGPLGANSCDQRGEAKSGAGVSEA